MAGSNPKDMRMPPPDEQTLVARARSRDMDAFGMLVTRYQGAMERILLPLAGSRDLARDWAQDAVLRAYRNLHLFREGHRFASWFFRIGVNLALSAKRREKLDARARDAASLAGTSRDDASPLDQLIEEEDLALLRGRIAALPERYQEVMRLRYGDGLSCGDIAQRLRTTPNTISIVLFRAKQKLREDRTDS